MVERVSAVTPAAGAVGTRVEVRDLFFSDTGAVEIFEIGALPRRPRSASIAEASRYADIRQNIRFTLTSGNGRKALTPIRRKVWRGRNSAERLGAILRGAILPIMPYRSAGGAATALCGFSDLPDCRLSTARHAQKQYLVVNGTVRCATKAAQWCSAAARAKISAMHGNRHPHWLFFIELPSEAVDVNVHPCQTEVRCGDAGHPSAQ